MSAESMVREHRSQLIQLRSMADADIRSLLAVVQSMPVAEVRDLLIEALPEIVAPYTTASGELAAVLFEDLRAEAGRRGVFYADVVAPLPPPSKVDATARWAVAPLADEALGSSVQTRLTGAVGRMIMDASRETVEVNGARESVRFQRMARPGACAFCGMLASRPPYMAYRSAGSAGEVVGRGTDESVNFNPDGTQRLFGNRMAKGIKARGSQSLGDAYHDDCRCVVMPIYGGSEMAELARVERDSWAQKYSEALPPERTDGMTLAEMDAAIRRGESVVEARDIKQILSNWRKVHGTR